ncbi:MAG: glycosyltransferase [Candidatus Krumholzibacteriia bacterium]
MTGEPRPALVSAGELFGGAERHLLGLGTWLRRQEHEPLLVLFHDRELAAQARQAGLATEILPVRGPFDPRGPGLMGRVLDRHGANVVHAHGYRAMVNTALARRGRQFACVRTVHGMLEHHGLNAAAVRSRLYSGLEILASRRCGALVCCVTDDLRRRGGEAGARTIRNGIDPLRREDYPRPAAYADGAFHTAAVGRLIPVKGLDVALEALALVPAAAGVVLHLVGSGPEQNALERRAAALGLGGRARFHGFRADAYAYIAHADLLLMPSRHEGLPYTILEAMSLGVPVLAARVGGLAEVLVGGEDAVLVAADDVRGLAAAWTELATDPANGRALAEAARRKQSRELDLDAMGRAYWQAYGDALAGRGAGAPAVEAIP